MLNENMPKKEKMNLQMFLFQQIMTNIYNAIDTGYLACKR